MGLRRSRVGFIAFVTALGMLIYNLPWFSPGKDRSLVGDNDLDQSAGQQAQDVLPVVSPGRPQWYHYIESHLTLEPTATGQRFPITSTESLPLPVKSSLPRIQHTFDAETNGGQKQERRLAAVKAAFNHSWYGYKNRAWLHDELSPITGSGRETFGGWSVTMIDSLDTLWLMDMKADFEEAVNAVNKTDFSQTKSLPINVFETTIRHLGGLLGAYDISNAKYPSLLTKATDIADFLLGAFDTPNRMPVTRWNNIGVEVASGTTIVAELASLSLEFTRLSQLTGDMKYYDAVSRITDCIVSQQMNTKEPGLLPEYVNARECDFSQHQIFTLGAMSDSTYEYMVKEYQLLRGASQQYASLWENAVGPIKEHVLFRPQTPEGLDVLMAGSLNIFQSSKVLNPQVQHLSCFAGGMFALASKLFDSPSDLEIGIKLTEGCIWAYNATQTGLMPELFHVVPCDTEAKDCAWNELSWFQDLLSKNSNDESPSDKQRPMKERMALKTKRLHVPKGMTAMASREYRLRPEAIESIFVLYRITGNEYYREMGWKMFEAIAKYTRTEYGYSSIEDVTVTDVRGQDKMESFWMAETLKYFLLLFESHDVLSLDEWVLSTEAHGFKLDWKG